MASLYSTFPTMFDTTQLIPASQWEESSDVVEAVGNTEAGTDTVDVARYDKMTIDVQYKVAEASTLGEWAKILKGFSVQPSIQVKRYDILTQTYQTRTMRMRKFVAKLVPKSDLIPSVHGIWEISFKLIEF